MSAVSATALVPNVYIVDDEPGMVKALSRLLTAEGFVVRGFTSSNAFLQSVPTEPSACLVLDVAMPELDGLMLQQKLAEAGKLMPIVFLTGHGDIPMSVKAIQRGAIDFLTKPIKDAALLGAVRAALDRAMRQRDEVAEISSLRGRFATLTPREREVLQHVITGQLNKQIAGDLGTGIHTIKIHRGRVMRKMGVNSVADLVRAAERLGVS